MNINIVARFLLNFELEYLCGFSRIHGQPGSLSGPKISKCSGSTPLNQIFPVRGTSHTVDRRNQ